MSWRPPKRKKIQTGQKAPVNLDLERRIEAARSKALQKKYKDGERHHARVNTNEFRAGYDQIDWSH